MENNQENKENKENTLERKIMEKPSSDVLASAAWLCYGCDSDNLKSWEERLMVMFAVDTYEELAEWFNDVDISFSLVQYHGFYLFRNGIPPVWEDETNKNGGHWAYLILPAEKDRLSTIWDSVTKIIMDEKLEYKEQISGCVLNASKKKYKLSVWTIDSEKKKEIMHIGRVLKESLGSDARLEYCRHVDVIRTGNQHATKKKFIL